LLVVLLILVLHSREFFSGGNHTSGPVADLDAARKKALAEAEAARKEEHQAHVERGRNAMAAKRFDEAVAAFDKAAELRPEDKETQALLQEAKDAKFLQLVQRGRAAMDARRYRDAVEACTAACKLRPEN
jgi:tetratricopeptide (TPR) repeat protein